MRSYICIIPCKYGMCSDVVINSKMVLLLQEFDSPVSQLLYAAMTAQERHYGNRAMKVWDRAT